MTESVSLNEKKRAKVRSMPKETTEKKTKTQKCVQINF